MHLIFIILSALIAPSTFALHLQPISEPNLKPLPVGQGPIACKDIHDQLLRYNDMARQHDQSVGIFLSEVSAKVSSWYDVLAPLENTQQNIPLDTFAPLQQGAQHIQMVTDRAFENSDLLATELDRIITSLRDCLTTKSKRRSRR